MYHDNLSLLAFLKQ